MALKPSLVSFKFKRFESLTNERVISDRVADCHGNKLQLCLRPGVRPAGNSNDEAADDHVGLFLNCKGDKDVHVKYSFIMRDSTGNVYHEHSMEPHVFKGEENGGWGVPRFTRRSTILNKENNILHDGALFVDVLIQYVVDRDSLHKAISSRAMKMLQLLDDATHADVSFKIGDTIISAHKAILSMHSPVLLNFCHGNDGESPIAIDDTTPEAFRIILRYLYGEEVPDAETIIETSGKDIISAADRFGVVELKLAVESSLVGSSVMTKENAADWLVFADSKTCPLLKEQATAYIVTRPEDILNSEHAAMLKESPKLLTELVMEVSRRNNDSPLRRGESGLSVSELRKQLAEKRLDIDDLSIAGIQEAPERRGLI